MQLSTRLRFKGSLSLCDGDGVRNQGSSQEVQLDDVLVEAGGVVLEGRTLDDVERILKGEPGVWPRPEPCQRILGFRIERKPCEDNRPPKSSILIV